MFDQLSFGSLKTSDLQALRREYAKEDEAYFRYMLVNGLKNKEKSKKPKA